MCNNDYRTQNETQTQCLSAILSTWAVDTGLTDLMQCMPDHICLLLPMNSLYIFLLIEGNVRSKET